MEAWQDVNREIACKFGRVPHKETFHIVTIWPIVSKHSEAPGLYRVISRQLGRYDERAVTQLHTLKKRIRRTILYKADTLKNAHVEVSAVLVGLRAYEWAVC